MGFTIGVTVYLNDVAPRGRRFSHCGRVAIRLWQIFLNRIPLLSLNMHHPGGIVERDMTRIFDLNEPVELVGQGRYCVYLARVYGPQRYVELQRSDTDGTG